MMVSEPRGVLPLTITVKVRELRPDGQPVTVKATGHAIILRVKDDSLSRRKWERFRDRHAEDEQSPLFGTLTVIDVDDGAMLVIGDYAILTSIVGNGVNPKPWVQDWNYVLATDIDRMNREHVRRDMAVSSQN
jgi:hypothetical protein